MSFEQKEGSTELYNKRPARQLSYTDDWLHAQNAKMSVICERLKTHADIRALQRGGLESSRRRPHPACTLSQGPQLLMRTRAHIDICQRLHHRQRQGGVHQLISHVHTLLMKNPRPVSSVRACTRVRYVLHALRSDQFVPLFSR